MADRVRDLVASRTWYHTIEVAPGVRTPGRYDPAPLLEAMKFPTSFRDKTVLDIGCMDGFFAFEAERRGARRVVAMDRHPADHCGFAVARELLGSKVEYTTGSVYDLSPEVHGDFDVVLFLGVFYHLRHPLLALDRIHAVCKELLFLETQVLDDCFVHEGRERPLADVARILPGAAILQFYPADELYGDLSNWFAPTARCAELMLATSGFRVPTIARFGRRAAFHAVREAFDPPHWY
jgi:tRNA (mo5U34)-methyltransferase